MSNTSSRGSRAGLEPALLTLLAEQQSRWQRGERVLVEVYLAQRPALSGDSEAVLELILHEVLLQLGSIWPSRLSLACIPLYWLIFGFGKILAVGIWENLLQAVVQGLFSGAGGL